MVQMVHFDFSFLGQSLFIYLCIIYIIIYIIHNLYRYISFPLSPPFSIFLMYHLYHVPSVPSTTEISATISSTSWQRLGSPISIMPLSPTRWASASVRRWWRRNPHQTSRWDRYLGITSYDSGTSWFKLTGKDSLSYSVFAYSTSGS